MSSCAPVKRVSLLPHRVPQSRAALSQLSRAADGEPQQQPLSDAESKGNAFDAVALLASAGSASLAASPAVAAAAAESEANVPPDASSSSGGAAAPAVVKSSLLPPIPSTSALDRTLARNLADLRRIALAKRRLWETRNQVRVRLSFAAFPEGSFKVQPVLYTLHPACPCPAAQVLGRVATSNVRAPRQALTLSSSGLTTVADIDKGTGATGATAIAAHRACAEAAAHAYYA